MANEVIIEFKADTRGLEPALDLLQKTGQIDKKTAEQIRTDNKAWKEREDAVKKVGEAQKVVADPKNQPKPVPQEVHQSFESLDGKIKKVGHSLAAAFAVHQIIEFAKESIEAYAKQEKAEQQLFFAVGRRVDVQKELIAQAKMLQHTTGVADEDIVKQQAFLALQGQTTAQIKKTTQAAIELSAATGVNLEEATHQLTGTFEGITKGIARYDERIKKLTFEQLQNGEAVDIINEKYKGFAESTLETTAGKIKQTEIRIDELKESIGERLAGAFTTAQEKGLTFFEKMLTGFNFLVNPTKESAHQLQEYLEKVEHLGHVKFANSSIKELEAELARVNSVGVANDLERAQREKQIEVLNELIAEKRRARDEEREKQSKKELVSLDTLKAKLQFLHDQQQELVDPLGVGHDRNIALIKEIEDTEKIIDEITGKAAEEREKRDKAAFDKATKERLKAQEDYIQKLVNVKPKKEPEIRTRLSNQKSDPENDLRVLEMEAENLQAVIDQVENAAIQSFEDTIFSSIQTSIDLQIEALHRYEDEQNKALDERLDRNKQAYDDELISARTFRANEKVLLDQKTANEIAAQKKITDLKRQAAIANKLEKLFEIAINTATNVIKQPGPLGAFIPYWVALGATEAGLVAAQSLPKYHTGRLAKGRGEEMAIIQREETITDAKKSKQYGPTLEAIHYGKIPAMALNDFVRSFTVKDFSRETPVISVSMDPEKMASAFGWQVRGQEQWLKKIYYKLHTQEPIDYRSIH